MSNIIETFGHISYKRIISIALFLTVLLAVPVAVYIVGQKTKISSRAAYKKPEIMESSKAKPGPLPENEPEIGRVYPWLGKEGDIIWIQGNNFGINPRSKSLKIGGVKVGDNLIDVWEDDLIQAYIPDGAVNGGIAEIKVGNYPTAKSLPITIYDRTTKLQLVKKGETLSVRNGEEAKEITIWTGDDEIETKMVSKDIKTNSAGEAVVYNTEGLPILSILIRDNKGYNLAYYVNPIEFGF